MGRDREDLWLCDRVSESPHGTGVSGDPTLPTTPPAFLFSSLFQHSPLLKVSSLVIIAMRLAKALRYKEQTLSEAKNIEKRRNQTKQIK